MPEQKDYTALVKGILKAEMKRREITYKALSARLQEMGVHETEANLRNKISRGGFSAAFFVQCLDCMGVTDLRLA